MSAKCPVCCQGLIMRDTWKKDFQYKDATLTADYSEEYCDACGTLLQSPKTIRDNARNEQREKIKYDQLLTGDEILSFRNLYGFTQKLAAQLFGGGESAFAKYEVDEIAHNISMDRLLRVCISDPSNILLLAKLAKITLPEEVTLKINEAIRERAMAAAKAAFAALKESAPEWRTEEAQSANDNVFEIYAADNCRNRKNTSEWAVELEIAA